MIAERTWAKTSVHKASTYSCAHCGRGFKSPHLVYAHIEKQHPTKRPKPRIHSDRKSVV